MGAHEGRLLLLRRLKAKTECEEHDAAKKGIDVEKAEFDLKMHMANEAIEFAKKVKKLDPATRQLVQQLLERNLKTLEIEPPRQKDDDNTG